MAPSIKSLSTSSGPARLSLRRRKISLCSTSRRLTHAHRMLAIIVATQKRAECQSAHSTTTLSRRSRSVLSNQCPCVSQDQMHAWITVRLCQARSSWSHKLSQSLTRLERRLVTRPSLAMPGALMGSSLASARSSAKSSSTNVATTSFYSTIARMISARKASSSLESHSSNMVW